MCEDIVAISELIAVDASVIAVGEEFNGDALVIFLSGNIPFIFINIFIR